MTFDPKKRVRLFNGRHAYIIKSDLNDKQFTTRDGRQIVRPIVAVHVDPDGSEEIWLHQANGVFGSDVGPSSLSLVNIEEPQP